MITEKLKQIEMKIIVPDNNEDGTGCTEIFNLITKSWEVPKWTDNRVTPMGGTALSFKDNTRVIYVGGFLSNTTQRSNRIYEFEEGFGWRLWSTKLPLQTANTLLMLSDNEFCDGTGFKQMIDTSNMTLV